MVAMETRLSVGYLAERLHFRSEVDVWLVRYSSRLAISSHSVAPPVQINIIGMYGL